MTKFNDLINQDQEQKKELRQFYAFNNKQLQDGLIKIQATEKDIKRIGSTGLFIHKDDIKAYFNISSKTEKNIKELFKKDDTETFKYIINELITKEWEYCNDWDDIFNEYSYITYEEIRSDKRLNKLFNKAVEQLQEY